jgi:hypothetical protein
MAPAKSLASLELQKRLLLAESEARRLVLAAELNHVVRPVRFLERWQLRARPLFLVGVPVAAYALARRSRGKTRWIATALGAARVFSSLRHYLRPHAADSPSESSGKRSRKRIK